MTKLILQDNRQLIPRWHTSRKHFRFFAGNSSQSVFKGLRQRDDFLNKSEIAWKSERNISNAVDYLARSIDYKLDNLIHLDEVKHFLLAKQESVSRPVLSLIDPKIRLLDKSKYYAHSIADIRGVISKLKGRVRFFPRDSYSWCDLAFYYNLIGQVAQAERCFSVALSLAPYDVFVLRSYSRFLVNLNRPDEAYSLLMSSGMIYRDSMITGAAQSISLAFDLKRISVSKSIKTIENSHQSPLLNSELAASIATVEYQHGANKKGKNFLDVAVQMPSENTISQTNWLCHKVGIKNIERFHDLHDKSLESEATQKFQERDYIAASSKLVEAFQFQPFSERALVDASYVSLVGAEDVGFVTDVVGSLVDIDRSGFGLANNLAVAYLKSGDYERASSYLNRLMKFDVDSAEEATKLATLGLFAFEAGDEKKGVDYYEESVRLHKLMRHERSLAIAYYFYGNAMKSYDDNRAKSLLNQSITLAKKHKIHELIKN